jgi:hypothetical protein
MKKKLFITLMVIVLLLAAVVPALAQSEPDRVSLTIINKTGGLVTLSMTGDTTSTHYFLAVSGGENGYNEAFYTVDRDTYQQVTYACGITSPGTLDATIQVKLVFVACDRALSTNGEPSQQKISLGESPPSPDYFYQFD